LFSAYIFSLFWFSFLFFLLELYPSSSPIWVWNSLSLSCWNSFCVICDHSVNVVNSYCDKKVDCALLNTDTLSWPSLYLLGFLCCNKFCKGFSFLSVALIID
jgi:hypothetical protein